ncbi:MAG: transglycosylase domain-containing protein [Bacteroidetes bacterium]|nr:transglycosylase domain-containing protein [Bacteroidota bacterium]
MKTGVERKQLKFKILSIFKDKNRIRKILIWIFTSFFLLILLTFIFRSAIVSFYIQKKITSFNKAYQAEISVGRIKMVHLNGILFTGIIVKPVMGDTLLTIDSLKVAVNFWKILTGHFTLKEMEIRNVRVNLHQHDSTDNFSFLLKGHHHIKTDTLSATVNLASRARILFKTVFDKIPSTLKSSNITVTYNRNGHVVSFFMDHCFPENNIYKCAIRLSEDDHETEWVIEGQIDKDQRVALVKLYSADRSKVKIPFLQHRWNVNIGVDTVAFNVSESGKDDDLTVISGSVAIRGLNINHEKVAASPVLFDQLGFGFSINVGKDYIELDSSTLVRFNKIDFHPYLRFRQKPTMQITFGINKPDFPAGDLFGSIPEGLFTSFSGMAVKGDLSYRLSFYVDLSQPDSLKFDSELKRNHFSVLSYGACDLAKINEPFPHTAYERGDSVRTIIVGPENPNFRTLEHISPYLQASILNSEDGGFYQHRGFLPEAFRDAIITNIKEKKFVRGGSTISMQLVKNVFLQRNKTIGRKLEEVLLVWLLENQGISTKDRMYEVYLNIIEWGPMVYGANEAARFYFNKDASKLTLAESIFLASIIPKPKWFRYSFDDDGHLRASNAGFYKLLSEKMLRKGQITEADFEELVPDVDLKGPAKLLLKQKGPLPADSVNSEEGFDLLNY